MKTKNRSNDHLNNFVPRLLNSVVTHLCFWLHCSDYSSKSSWMCFMPVINESMRVDHWALFTHPDTAFWADPFNSRVWTGWILKQVSVSSSTFPRSGFFLQNQSDLVFPLRNYISLIWIFSWNCNRKIKSLIISGCLIRSPTAHSFSSS